MTKKWSVIDVSQGARTIHEIECLSKKPASRSMGCKFIPIFRCIPIDHVIIDTLHLFLHISDLLIDLIIMELRCEDGIEKNKAKLDRTKQTNLARYEKFLNDFFSLVWYQMERSHWS